MTAVTSGNVESPVVVTNGGAVVVTWMSVVSVIETGVEKVDSGVSVTVVLIVERVPEPVGNSVTETGEDWATSDGPFDTVTEALLGTAGLTGERMVGNVGDSEVVGEDSEGHVVLWAGTEAGGKGFTTAVHGVHDEAEDDDDFA